MMTNEAVLDRFKRINVWHKGDKRAPHKPLLLLYAPGRCGRKEGNQIPYLDVERDLKPLIEDFGSPGTPRPEMPFGSLQNDNLWFVQNSDKLERRKDRTDPKRSEFLKHNPIGGLLPDVYDALVSNAGLLEAITKSLLEAHFPESLHSSILEAVGLTFDGMKRTYENRDSGFRHRILRAYGYRCAVCGLDLKLGSSDLALDAAHIKWRQAGDPNVENNGLALCVLHHRLFDRGAFSLADDHSIQVSQEVHGSTGLSEILLSFHGNEIILPQSDDYRPLRDFLRWHRREVFRGPSRD